MAIADQKPSKPLPAAERPSGVASTPTVLRGLALLECVARGINEVKSIAAHLEAPHNTVLRMLSSLVSEGFLFQITPSSYLLGPKLIYLGNKAQEQRPLRGLARPFLKALAEETGDTVHLGTPEGMQVFYLDKIPGTRGLEMRSRVGQHMPLASTGVGRALMLGMDSASWRRLYDEAADGVTSKRLTLNAWPDYWEAMQRYLGQDWVMDLEENELGIRCVAAPVRDITGRVVAAVSVASATSYMSNERMLELGPKVHETAQGISEKLRLENVTYG